MTIIKENAKRVMYLCSAPKPSPMDIHKNKYTNSSGSFMAALNLTIDNAPTKPRDRAKEDLIIVITRNVVRASSVKLLENLLLLDKLRPNFMYIVFKIKDNTAAKSMSVMKRGTLMLDAVLK